MAKAQSNNPHRPNVWSFLKEAVNKGQIIPILLSLVAIVGFFKMTSEQIYSLAHEGLLMLKEFHILGWVGTIIITPLSIFLFKRSERLHKKEIERYVLRIEMLENKGKS